MATGNIEITVGIKYDGGKPRYDLLPPAALEQVVKVFTWAVEHKYPERNWEMGISWGRLFAAIMRHLWAWAWREDNDPETGLPHLAHAGCGVLMLLQLCIYSRGCDSRATETKPPTPKENKNGEAQQK